MIGLFFLLVILVGPTDLIVKMFAIISIIFTLFAIIWINYLISYNHLQPLINRINRENQEVWVRITKNKLLTFQVVKRGVYGQTKGIVHRMKSDVIDRGDFPIQTINGNNAIIVYDKMSHNINLDHAVGWKQLFKTHKVGSAKEAYTKAEKVYPHG